jgi:glycosyltransferase involved in cell wall biosynthesis
MNAPTFDPLVIVTPVYDDVDACRRLFEELTSELEGDFIVVVVDDGSVLWPIDSSLLEEAGLGGVVIRLKRNVGHQRALAVGINYVAEHMPEAVCVLMDADGEDAPTTIRLLTEPLRFPDVDISVAERGSRFETLNFKIFYLIYKTLFYILSGRRISFGNFMALKPASVRRLAAMQELWIHVAATTLVSKLRLAFHPINRAPRYAGKSSMSFGSLVLHGFRALMVVAEDVLIRVGIACIIMAIAALSAIILSIVLKFFGFSTPGWFSTALGLLMLILMQTATLALITLMLTGVVRGNMVPVDYRDFIEKVLKTKGCSQETALNS